MKRKDLKYLSLALIAFLVIAGCKRYDKPGVLIKQEDMTKILLDLYIADGVLNNAAVKNDFSLNDSTENYMSVIKKHGYTMPEFEENIEYYFKSEPRKYEEIYDNVLAVLSGMLAKNIQDRGVKNPRNKNLWDGKASYRLPDDGTANPIEFSIPSQGPGKYLIRARLTIFTDDQTLNPRSNVYFWYDDGSEEGYRSGWDTVYYEKSSRSFGLKLNRELRDTNVTHIKGRLIDFTPQSGHWEMHSSISGITVSFNSFETTDSASIYKR